MPREPLYPHKPKSRQPQFPHVPGGRQPSTIGLYPQTATASATMTLTLPPETKQAMLDLCRRAKDKVEFGMILPVVNNEVIAGPTKLGLPDSAELKPLMEAWEAREAPYGVFHTHPESEGMLPELELSDMDRGCPLIYDYCLFTAVGTPYHNYAKVSAKRKMAGPELKRRLDKIIKFGPVMETLGLSLFVNTPDEIVEFLETEGLLSLLADLKGAGGPVPGMAQYLKEYSICLDDGKSSYIEVVSPGVLPEDQIRLFHTQRSRVGDEKNA